MKKSIQEIKLHDHTCLVFKDDIEFFHCAIPFIREGLRTNERCLIVIDEITREDIFRKFTVIFREGHIPPTEFGDKGRITIKSFKEVYLKERKFDLEYPKSFYSHFLKSSLESGYKGIRIFVEIGVTAKNYIADDIFLKWEIFADNLFPHNKFLAVCAYNKKYFSPVHLNNVVKLHPIEVDIMKTRL